jgi:hypothetical protein
MLLLLALLPLTLTTPSCSSWNQASAQAAMERTLEAICKELQADGVRRRGRCMAVGHMHRHGVVCACGSLAMLRPLLDTPTLVHRL